MRAVYLEQMFYTSHVLNASSTLVVSSFSLSHLIGIIQFASVLSVSVCRFDEVPLKPWARLAFCCAQSNQQKFLYFPRLTVFCLVAELYSCSNDDRVHSCDCVIIQDGRHIKKKTGGGNKKLQRRRS